MSKPDNKTELTFKTVENLKNSGALFGELIKMASNYQKQVQKTAELGQQLADTLRKCGQIYPYDLGEGIIKLADTIKLVETRRDAVSQSLQNDLINSLQKSSKPDEGEIAQFEADYKKTRSKMRETISKLEVNSKKAGKKNPGELQKNSRIERKDQRSGSTKSRKVEECSNVGKEEVL